jgi:hypothetical protein
MADDNGIPSSALESQALGALVDMLKSATTPDALQAQTILLRRLALQGDVTGSRVPAPLNITEIGGYLNLLETLQQPEIQAQTLTGILGVAGPNPPLGWLATKPPLSLVSSPNDRPVGPSQPAIPLEFWVRSDFAEALQDALADLHDQGCALPLLTQLPVLPPASPGATPPSNVLPFLGRALNIVPGTALRDHTTDPIVLARAQGTTDPFRAMARVLSAGSVAVAPANWDALECDDTSCAPVAVNNAQYVPLEPALASAGFYPEAPPPQPAALASVAWAQFTNVTGLVAGVTRLGDELALLYSTADMNGSVFGPRLHWVWDGTAFAAGA